MKIMFLVALCLISINSISAIENNDRIDIQKAIYGCQEAWNSQGGKGYGNDYTVDADFVNIFGMHFYGQDEIEKRHIQILESFLKGTTFNIVDLQLREVHPDLVIAHVHWTVRGFQVSPETKTSSFPDEGIFTHVLVKEKNGWKITASQNTLLKR